MEETQNSPIDPENKNKSITYHINHFALFTFIIACLLIAGLYGYYFVQSKTISQTVQPTARPISINPTSIVSFSPTPVLPTSEPLSIKSFTKRHFDVTEKFFSTQSFPSTLLNMNENELISMRCTQWFENVSPSEDQTHFSYYNESLEKSVRLTDAQLLNLIQPANKTLPSGSGTISSIRGCETENGTYIVIYSLTRGGGGAGSDTYFAFANSDNSLQKITTIPSENGAYFACHQPLQLTKTNLLYYRCSGGEGTMASIYEVDLNKNTNKLFYQCIYTRPFSEDSKVECK